MSKRNRREHGRILSVDTMQRGAALDVDAAAGATTITVTDAGDFDEDGGWLYIGAQVVEFTACDDETGVITLADPLTAAAEQGDPVYVYDPLYGEVVDYQEALVELDGEYDNPDPVTAEVGEGVSDLPEGDRGKAGESCVLKRVGDDEWEIVGVGGRGRKSRGLKAEADDFYVLTAGDITSGVATIPLSHRPADEWLVAFWRTTPQEPSEYTVNYDDQTITWPLSGFEAAGDRIWVHYAYRKGLPVARRLRVPLGHVWKYATGLGASTAYAATGFDDSAWPTGPSPFGWRESAYAVAASGIGTTVPHPMDVWTRTTGTTQGGDLTISVNVDDNAWVYIDGVLVGSVTVDDTLTVACDAGLHTFAVRGTDFGDTSPSNTEGGYLAVTITEGAG